MVIDLLWQDEETVVNSHPLWLRLLETQASICKRLQQLEIDGVAREMSLKTVQNPRYFNDIDRLNFKTFTLLQEVMLKIDRIQQCAYMLDFYPEDIRTAWFTPLKRGEYLEQIMELYIMHSLGLVDRVLILYDYLFDFGLPWRSRTMNNMVKHLSKKDGFPLFAFCQVFRAVKKSRNLIAHEYRYIDSELIDLVLEDTFAREEYRASMPEAKTVFSKLNRRYDKKMRELFKNIAANDQILNEYFLPIMEVWERQYKKRAKGLNVE